MLKQVEALCRALPPGFQSHSALKIFLGVETRASLLSTPTLAQILGAYTFRSLKMDDTSLAKGTALFAAAGLIAAVVVNGKDQCRYWLRVSLAFPDR